MRVRFSDSEQWSSPVKPPRSQNYVKPHDAARAYMSQYGASHARADDLIVRAAGSPTAYGRSLKTNALNLRLLVLNQCC
jgi:hypothetical protein